MDGYNQQHMDTRSVQLSRVRFTAVSLELPHLEVSVFRYLCVSTSSKLEADSSSVTTEKATNALLVSSFYYTNKVRPLKMLRTACNPLLLRKICICNSGSKINYYADGTKVALFFCSCSPAITVSSPLLFL